MLRAAAVEVPGYLREFQQVYITGIDTTVFALILPCFYRDFGVFQGAGSSVESGSSGYSIRGGSFFGGDRDKVILGERVEVCKYGNGGIRTLLFCVKGVPCDDSIYTPQPVKTMITTTGGFLKV
jgi:hypothetical protein